MAPQEIAKALYNISATEVEADSAEEGDKLLYLLAQLEKLPPEKALRLLISVLHVKALQVENPNGYFNKPEYTDFPHIEYAMNGYRTDDYKHLPPPRTRK